MDGIFIGLSDINGEDVIKYANAALEAILIRLFSEFDYYSACVLFIVTFNNFVAHAGQFGPTYIML